MAGYNSIKILRGSSSTIQNLANNGTTLLDGQLLYIKDKNYLSVGTTGAEGSLSPINTSPITVRELRGYSEDANGITSNTDLPYYINYADDGLNIHSPSNVDITAPGEINSSTSGTLSFQGMTWNENVSNKQVTAQAVYSINTSIYRLNSPNVLINGSNVALGQPSSTTSGSYIQINGNIELQGLNSVNLTAIDVANTVGSGVKLNACTRNILLENISFLNSSQQLNLSFPYIIVNTSSGMRHLSENGNIEIITSNTGDVHIESASNLYLNAANNFYIGSNVIRYPSGSMNTFVNLPSAGLANRRLALYAEIPRAYVHNLRVSSLDNSSWDLSRVSSAGTNFTFFTSIISDNSASLSGHSGADLVDILADNYNRPANGTLLTDYQFYIIMGVRFSNAGSSNQQLMFYAIGPSLIGTTLTVNASTVAAITDGVISL